MEKAKRFFIALLTFCLIGNILAKAEVTADGFVYTEYPDFGYVFVTGYEGDATELKFPEFGEEVTVLVDENFVDNVANPESVTAIDLSNVDEVSSGAFVIKTSKKPTSSGIALVRTGFLNLTKVVLGDKVPEFFSGAFSGVTVTELAFSGTVASNASEFASTVTTIDLSPVITINAGAFQGFTKLTDARNFQNVTSIGDYAYSGCVGLTTLDLSKVESVGEGAFSGCTGLTEVDLVSVTSIGASAFENCGDAKTKKGLTSVKWSEKTTVFPAYIFSGCVMLNSITGLDEATEFGDHAFYNCSKLNGNVEFSNALESVGEDAFKGTYLTKVIVKSNPSMGEEAFSDAVTLELNIEDKVNFVNEGDNTFDKITYTRTFTAEKYATLVLPFVPDQVVSGDLEVFELEKARENDCLVFKQVPASDFQPGTPYLVKAKKNLTELTGTEAKSGMTNSTFGNWTMIGQYERAELNSTDAPANRRYYYYTSANGGQFVYATGKLVVSPFRTYIVGPIMTGSSSVRMMARGFDGGETAIDAVELEDLFTPTVGTCYDLNGCRVLAPVKGNMYIVNGKKVVF